MFPNKQSYFQGGGGVNEPTPKKTKYEPEKAIVIKPRFKELLFKNYDLYETPGEHSPGSGYHSMQQYKSIQEFLAAKRKKMKNKYKSDDFYINDKMKVRTVLYSELIKTAQDINNIDFPLDDQVDGQPVMIGENSSYDNSVQIGGHLDKSFPLYDFEDKSQNELDFGRDYIDDSSISLDKLMNKYLDSNEIGLFGLPDGIVPNSDLDAVNTINDENPFYGITDVGTQIY